MEKATEEHEHTILFCKCPFVSHSQVLARSLLDTSSIHRGVKTHFFALVALEATMFSPWNRGYCNRAVGVGVADRDCLVAVGEVLHDAFRQDVEGSSKQDVVRGRFDDVYL